MLFLKTEGSSLGVSDWMAQSASGGVGTAPDFLAEAAVSAWKAISQRGFSYAETIQEIERRLIATAVNVPGCTRREMAQRLRTSERTLYYKMRIHGIQNPAA